MLPLSSSSRALFANTRAQAGSLIMLNIHTNTYIMFIRKLCNSSAQFLNHLHLPHQWWSVILLLIVKHANRSHHHHPQGKPCLQIQKLGPDPALDANLAKKPSVGRKLMHRVGVIHSGIIIIIIPCRERPFEPLRNYKAFNILDISSHCLLSTHHLNLRPKL